MVWADMLDNIDWFLCINWEVFVFFGGLQVVFFGDMFQLFLVVVNDIEVMCFQLEYDLFYFFFVYLFED